MVQKNKLNGVDLHLNDPDPALFGPPTQTISGVTNKVPVVDNPNIKLPSQEVKNLEPRVAKQTTTQSTIDVDIDAAQVSGKQEGIGNSWSPNKFSPESIAGNDKFINAKTGIVESTSKLSLSEKIKTVDKSLDVTQNEKVSNAKIKLIKVQDGLPTPKIPKPPSSPRIKTVKIPRPSDVKESTDLLNLPKSNLGI